MQQRSEVVTYPAFPGFVALRRRAVDLSGRRGQQGTILLFVLTMVLILTVAAVSILAASLNADVTANKLQDSTKSQHRVDGALEEAVNEVRNDSTICSTTATLPVTVDGMNFSVDCTPVTPAPASSRIYNLAASGSSGSGVLGLAQVKVIDWPSLGWKLEVCDWLLGRNVTAPLNSCGGP